MFACLGRGNTPDVVNPVLVQPKTALFVRAVDEMLDVLPNVVRQLLKQHLCLVVGEWPHDSRSISLRLSSCCSLPVALLNGNSVLVVVLASLTAEQGDRDYLCVAVDQLEAAAGTVNSGTSQPGTGRVYEDRGFQLQRGGRASIDPLAPWQR